jgi:hypothetical protein
MHLFGPNLDHDYYFELPVKGSGIPNQQTGERSVALLAGGSGPGHGAQRPGMAQ